MSKRVSFGRPAQKQAEEVKVLAQRWVEARETPTEPISEAVTEAGSNVVSLPTNAETMKRFTIDVTDNLHKRIKSECAMRGAKMADVIREMLEQAFPGKA